jgi:hypothetical protein
MSPFALFLWVTAFICDCVYPYALWRIQKTEKMLEDRRKVDGNRAHGHKEKRLQ